MTKAEAALLDIETHSRDPSVAHQDAARCLQKQPLQRRFRLGLSVSSV